MCGFKPETILEICSRGIAFWNYQVGCFRYICSPAVNDHESEVKFVPVSHFIVFILQSVTMIVLYIIMC